MCPKVAVSRPKCGLQAPKDHPWSTSYVYHSAKAFASFSSQKKLFEEQLPAEPCKSVVALDRSGPVKDFPSRFFASTAKSNTSSSGSTWANTPEGEWTVLVDDGESLQARLRLDEGPGCQLHSVSVYRPNAKSLALRMNFAGCNDGADVVHVALELHVRRSEIEGGSSNLAEWMCSLMDHKACWQAKAPAGGRRLTAPLDPFIAIGLGHCVNRGPHPPEQRDNASTLEHCAQACIRKGQQQRPDDAAGCRGFAFSERHPHCILYGDFAAPSNAQQLYASGDWGCYAINGASGQVQDADATAHREATASPTYLAPLRVALKGSAPLRLPTALDLRGELGRSWHHAVRRRLDPLKGGCYEPFEWIVVDPEPQSQVTLNATAWDLITQHLPIAAAPVLEIESTLATDRVCVSLGGGATPATPAAEKEKEAHPGGASSEKAKCIPLSQLSPKEPAPKPPWKLICAALASAIIAAFVTVVIMDERIRNFLTPEKTWAKVKEGVTGMYNGLPTAEDLLHIDEKLPFRAVSQAPSASEQPLLETAGAGAEKGSESQSSGSARPASGRPAGEPPADEPPASSGRPAGGRPVGGRPVGGRRRSEDKELAELKSRLSASQSRKGPSRPAFNPALNAALVPSALASGEAKDP